MSATTAETITGSVSGQDGPGETVTISVARPDGVTDTLSTTTMADLSLAPAVYLPPAVAGEYAVTASIPADRGFHAAATSAPVTFVIGAPRTITISVSPPNQ